MTVESTHSKIDKQETGQYNEHALMQRTMTKKHRKVIVHYLALVSTPS